MAFDTINIGAAPNDGTGDTLRTGGAKINANFAEAFNNTEQLKAINGTASAPTYSFDSSPTTGLYRADTNTLAFSTDGAERVRVTSGGDVGIGTTSPDTRLHVVDVSLSVNAGLLLQTVTANNTQKFGLLKSAHYDNSEAPITALFCSNTNTANSMRIGGSYSLENAATEILFYTAANNTTKIGTERMRIDSAGSVGIGTTSPTFTTNYGTLSVNGSTGGQVAFQRNGTGNSFIFYDGVSGNLQLFNTLPENIIFSTNSIERMRIAAGGAVTVVGSLSKGSGSFKIDHPLKPDTHHLVHSFIEGPQADLIYRGKATLVNGKAVVNVDEAGRMSDGTFEALNRNVQCFTNNESGWTAVRGSVVGNILTIEAQDEDCTDEISWLVIGERCDPHMIETDWTDENGRVITEPEKEAVVEEQSDD